MAQQRQYIKLINPEPNEKSGPEDLNDVESMSRPALINSLSSVLEFSTWQHNRILKLLYLQDRLEDEISETDFDTLDSDQKLEYFKAVDKSIQSTIKLVQDIHKSTMEMSALKRYIEGLEKSVSRSEEEEQHTAQHKEVVRVLEEKLRQKLNEDHEKRSKAEDAEIVEDE